MKRTIIEWQGRNLHHLDLTEEDLIAELRRENELLRGQLDTARKLSEQAWKHVSALGKAMTNEEHDKYHGCLLRDDFDELMEDRYVDSQG